MVSAYIMAKIETGKEKEVFSKIKEIEEIKEAITMYGTYDLLVKVIFRKNEDLDDFVFNVLRQISGVKETVTMVVVKSIV